MIPYLWKLNRNSGRYHTKINFHSYYFYYILLIYFAYLNMFLAVPFNMMGNIWKSCNLWVFGTKILVFTQISRKTTEAPKIHNFLSSQDGFPEKKNYKITSGIPQTFAYVALIFSREGEHNLSGIASMIAPNMATMNKCQNGHHARSVIQCKKKLCSQLWNLLG